MDQSLTGGTAPIPVTMPIGLCQTGFPVLDRRW